MRRSPFKWRKRRLGALASFRNGRAFRSDEWVSEGVPIIRIQNLNGGATFNYFDGAFDDDIAVQPGDLLFSWSGNRGTSFGSYRWEGPAGVLNQHIFKVTPALGVDSSFLMHALDYATDRLEGRAHGASGLVHVKKSELTKFEVMVPDSAEAQSAIAGLLERVTSLQRRLLETVTAKRAFKRALMNDLLAGRRRFPEFSQADSWQEVALSELVTIRSGGTPTRSSAEYWGGTLPWVTAKEMKQFFLHDTEATLTATGAEELGTLAEPGQVLILVRGDLAEQVRVGVPLRTMAFNQDIKLLVPDSDRVMGEFLGRVLGEVPAVLQSRLTITGHGLGRLDTEQLRRARIRFPGLTEQRRICEVCRALDTEITLLERSAEEHSTFKRGLMQRLLSGEVEIPEHLTAASAAVGGNNDNS